MFAFCVPILTTVASQKTKDRSENDFMCMFYRVILSSARQYKIIFLPELKIMIIIIFNVKSE
jgi:hypothetical protein